MAAFVGCCSFTSDIVEYKVKNSDIDEQLKNREPIDTFLKIVVPNRIEPRVYRVLECLLSRFNEKYGIDSLKKFITSPTSIRANTEYLSIDKKYMDISKVYKNIHTDYKLWLKKGVSKSFGDFFRQHIYDTYRYQKLQDLAIEITNSIAILYFQKDISAKRGRYNMDTVRVWLKDTEYKNCKGYTNLLDLQIHIVNEMVPRIIDNVITKIQENQ